MADAQKSSTAVPVMAMGVSHCIPCDYRLLVHRYWTARSDEGRLSLPEMVDLFNELGGFVLHGAGESFTFAMLLLLLLTLNVNNP